MRGGLRTRAGLAAAQAARTVTGRPAERRPTRGFGAASPFLPVASRRCAAGVALAAPKAALSQAAAVGGPLDDVALPRLLTSPRRPLPRLVASAVAHSPSAAASALFQ